MIGIAILVWVGLAAQAETARPETREVAERYLRTNFRERDVERSNELLAEDAFFVDPTGEVFSGVLPRGVRGRSAILELQRSWGVAEAAYEVGFGFVTGEYAIHAGELDVEYAGGARFEGIPFACLLRVRDGAIVERRDYGDYRAVAQGALAPEPELEAVARAYHAAYTGRRLDDMAELYAEDVAFQDPTAEAHGGGARVVGREDVLKRLEAAFRGVLSFELKPGFELFFQRTAVFAGTCRYAVEGELLGLEAERIEFEMPGLMVLTIRDGRIVEHRDYADVDSVARQMARAAGGR